MFKAMAAANDRPDEDHEGHEDIDEHAAEAHDGEGDEQVTPDDAGVTDESPDGFDAHDAEESDESTRTR